MAADLMTAHPWRPSSRRKGAPPADRYALLLHCIADIRKHSIAQTQHRYTAS